MSTIEEHSQRLELEQIRARIAALNTEIDRNIRETRWPPVLIAAVILGVAGPVATLILMLWLLGSPAAG